VRALCRAVVPRACSFGDEEMLSPTYAGALEWAQASPSSRIFRVARRPKPFLYLPSLLFMCLCSLTLAPRRIHMFDVGGQRLERKKWIHCFERCVCSFRLLSPSSFLLFSGTSDGYWFGGSVR
jgi:hypothetical protein